MAGHHLEIRIGPMDHTTDATRSTTTTGTALVGARTATGGFVALRIVMGLVWLSNGLAKLFDAGQVDWGFLSFTLITRDGALGIATNAAGRSQLTWLGDFYRDEVVAHWGFWGVFLTVAELAIGLGLLLGVATRLAALGGLLLLIPIWVMLLHTGDYLWDYPLDLVPLALLVVVPAGRVWGLDRRIAPRLGNRWPC